MQLPAKEGCGFPDQTLYSKYLFWIMSTRWSVCSQVCVSAQCDGLNVKSTLALVMRMVFGWSVQTTVTRVPAQLSVLERWYLLRLWECQVLYHLYSLLNIEVTRAEPSGCHHLDQTTIVSLTCELVINSYSCLISCTEYIQVTRTPRPFPLPGWSLSRHCCVRQHVRDTSLRHQYSFGTPRLTVPSEILRVSCTCQQK